MTPETRPGELPRAQRMQSMPTIGDMVKLLTPVVITGLLGAIGLYYQVQNMKEANAAERAQQTQTLYRIESRVEKIDDSVRGIEIKVTAMDSDAKGVERRLGNLERR